MLNTCRRGRYQLWDYQGEWAVADGERDQMSGTGRLRATIRHTVAAAHRMYVITYRNFEKYVNYDF